MRHVSSTHRIARDWLFDRINLDPKIQIKYIDTKNQVADILTKRNVTRDEWNTLLHLFNISHFSSLCCAKNFRLICCTKWMAKRMQEQKEENRIVAKSRPTASSCPIASRSPGILKAPSRQIGSSGRHVVVSANQNSSPDAASSSQGWQRVALLDTSTGRPAAAEKDHKS